MQLFVVSQVHGFLLCAYSNYLVVITPEELGSMLVTAPDRTIKTLKDLRLRFFKVKLNPFHELL